MHLILAIATIGMLPCSLAKQPPGKKACGAVTKSKYCWDDAVDKCHGKFVYKGNEVTCPQGSLLIVSVDDANNTVAFAAKAVCEGNKWVHPYTGRDFAKTRIVTGHNCLTIEANCPVKNTTCPAGRTCKSPFLDAGNLVATCPPGTEAFGNAENPTPAEYYKCNIFLTPQRWYLWKPKGTPTPMEMTCLVPLPPTTPTTTITTTTTEEPTTEQATEATTIDSEKPTSKEDVTEEATTTEKPMTKEDVTEEETTEKAEEEETTEAPKGSGHQGKEKKDEGGNGMTTGIVVAVVIVLIVVGVVAGVVVMKKKGGDKGKGKGKGKKKGKKGKAEDTEELSQGIDSVLGEVA